VKELKPYQLPPKPIGKSFEERAQDPRDVVYWWDPTLLRGRGSSSSNKQAVISWKFKCICGEECSSYEHYRYHPIGRMFECTYCQIWSHVDCVFQGPQSLSDEDLEEMEDILCKPCQARFRRKRKWGEEDDHLQQHQQIQSTSSTSSLSQLTPSSSSCSSSSSSSSSLDLKKKVDGEESSITMKGHEQKQLKKKKLDKEELTANIQWKFKCLCGEVCSSYENIRYHPKGDIYACVECGLRGHIVCNGNQPSSDEYALQLCAGCRSKYHRQQLKLHREKQQEERQLQIQQHRNQQQLREQQAMQITQQNNYIKTNEIHFEDIINDDQLKEVKAKETIPVKEEDGFVEEATKEVISKEDAPNIELLTENSADRIGSISIIEVQSEQYYLTN
jgi:hypothetical protein